MEAMEATYTITQGVPSLEYGGVTYKIVKLADDRWWMAENLRYLPAGKTPSSDPADGNGVWYPGSSENRLPTLRPLKKWVTCTTMLRRSA